MIPIILDEYEALASKKSLVLINIKSKEDGKRVRDYTPTEIDGEESGRADQFFQFIQQNVIPELEAKQYIDSTNTKSIIGHSIGGLAGCYAFIKYNSLFDNYIALSPSLFWDDFIFFQLEDELRLNIQQNNNHVFIGIGKNEDFGITNGYLQLVKIIENYYTNAQLSSKKVSGSHYNSRDELIKKSLNFILE